MICASIWLYGKPNWDLEIEGRTRLNPKIFKKHGDFMKNHLYGVADALEKLQFAGWSIVESYGALYSLDLYKEGVTTDEAEAELLRLGIDFRCVCIQEIEEEIE